VNFELAHCLFQCVSVASRPLRVEELTEFLAFDFKAGQIPQIRRGFASSEPDGRRAVNMSQSARRCRRGWLLLHSILTFSVKEFLTSTRLADTTDTISGRYHVDMTRAHTLVAQASLGILLHLDDEYVTSGSLETFPLVEYAALHWLGHAQYENVLEIIQEGTKRLFDPNKTTSRYLALDT